MKLMTISDCHISYDKGDTYDLVLEKLKFGLTQDLDYLFFLGDVFDLLIGSYNDYLEIFAEFFELIEEYSKTTNVIFIEGNHDVHFGELLNKINYSGNLYFCKEGYELRDNNKTLYFCHGDLIAEEDFFYILWRRFLSGRFMKYMLEVFFSFEDVERIGGRMSHNSRNRNKERYSDQINLKVQEKYRKKLLLYAQENNIHYLFAGHSHIKENFVSHNHTYLNNGFFPREKEVIIYANGNISFK